MTITAPDRTLEQRMTALQGANHIRSYRAQVKRDLKAGRRALVDVLELRHVDERLMATMKVRDVLLAAPKIGPTKANKVLNQALISPSKTLAGMTARQRAELVVRLELRTDRVRRGGELLEVA